ncbi:hypothetical protein BgiBS90_019971, partial [Biomphalaria glabrata]
LVNNYISRKVFAWKKVKRFRPTSTSQYRSIVTTALVATVLNCGKSTRLLEIMNCEVESSKDMLYRTAHAICQDKIIKKPLNEEKNSFIDISDCYDVMMGIGISLHYRCVHRFSNRSCQQLPTT